MKKVNINKSKVVDILGEILVFQFCEKAENSIKKIIQLFLSKDNNTKELAKIMMNKIFHDEKLSGAIMSSYVSRRYIPRGVSKMYNNIKTLGGNSLIGYRCFKHLQPTGYSSSLFALDELDRTQFRKYHKRCERILISLKKYNERYINTDN